MNDQAYAILLDRLDRDAPPDVVDVVLAAAEGADALDAFLAGGKPQPPRDTDPTRDPPAPARVYLDQIAVAGFRGIGERAELQLEPGPGLTLVVGRNGSGKSSFAEGLELLLTGTSLRWDRRPTAFRDGWRNLHADGRKGSIEARFRVDGEPTPLIVRRTWEPDAATPEDTRLEVSGPYSGWGELGWDQPLDRFRPLLSYNELGEMFVSRASQLYDALAAVLGLEDFDAVRETLRQARLDRKRSAKLEKDAKTSLITALTASDHPRARMLLPLVEARTPDLDAIEELLAGRVRDGASQPLADLVALELPDVDAITAAHDAHRDALAALQASEAADARQRDALADLLSEAVTYHAEHLAGRNADCPVCGASDALDEGWSIRAQATVTELKAQTDALRAARARVDETRASVENLFPAELPARLRAVGPAIAGTAIQAWDAWSADRHSTDRALELRLAVDDAVERASGELDRLDTAWIPIHAQASAWLDLARTAQRDRDAIKRVESAERWMTDTTADLRQERLAPIVDAAHANWEDLRHESNVSLGRVTLSGKGNARHTTVDVTVDGAPSSALGVMSQGELSALAISVFLPRASLPESPFGFMVIDDPVQSMDPAKVDGLARVLARAAETHQVVVFTHDERLPEAIRRMSIDARTIRVKRRGRSEVEIVASPPPSARYIDDAFALINTPSLPPAVKARVVPGFCRSAIEAACATRIRRRRLSEGRPHAAVEEELAQLESLRSWLAAAFGLTISQGHEIDDALRRIGGDGAVRLVRTVARGGHAPVDDDLETLTRTTRTLVRSLES